MRVEVSRSGQIVQKSGAVAFSVFWIGREVGRSQKDLETGVRATNINKWNLQYMPAALENQK